MLAIFSLNQVTQFIGQVIYKTMSYMSEAAINIPSNELNVLPLFFSFILSRNRRRIYPSVLFFNLIYVPTL